MSYVSHLECRECGGIFPEKPHYVCHTCFGPLEVQYDYEGIRRDFTPHAISAGPGSMWRYEALLPLKNTPQTGLNVGMTPLVKARRLGERLGLSNLYIKNDTVNSPSLSFKDRVVSVAISKALEFGFDTLACASTGNLANSLAAQSAAAGLRCFIFVPSSIEKSKVTGTLVYGAHFVSVEGNYDDVNRLCSELSALFPWAFVNINLRPYYAEGSKTVAYEIAEQLGWRIPDHIVVPVAGCSLLTKIAKGFNELQDLGWVEQRGTRIYGAQASGCSPLSSAVKEGSDVVRPVKPDTIARSLAIGNPADGHYGIRAIRDSGGWAEDVTDAEIVEGILLLARTEGIFSETAGGVAVGVTRKLVDQGRIGRDDLTVLTITGNGLKTPEALAGKEGSQALIEPTIESFLGRFGQDLENHAA